MKKDSGFPEWVCGLDESQRLDEIVRLGAQQMLRTALDAEVGAYMESVRDTVTTDGQAAIVRNGYHQERRIAVGAGMVKVSVPRTRDRSDSGERFVSSIVPKYMRRSLKIDEAIPLLYLRGLSTGDMLPALEKLLGEGVSGVSAPNVTRLKSIWKQEYEEWRKRDLSSKQYCYLWVDGIHSNVRVGDDRLCCLVVIGATSDGHKELVAVESGYRESKESWAAVLRDLKRRGMNCPFLVIGDGALGFWAGVKGVFPKAKWQRCWVHKTANILDALPKSAQPRAKRMIHDIYLAETKKKALAAYDVFVTEFEAKYPKAVECLTKDKEHLFTFFDFPAEHWQHIRSTNVIESTFATVRLRTKATRGHGTIETTLLMIYKLLEQAAMRWRRLRGYQLVFRVMQGEKFEDGVLKEAA
jgi:putative transposase